MDMLRNKMYRINEVIFAFNKARKLQITELFKALSNTVKSKKNKFKCIGYLVTNP